MITASIYQSNNLVVGFDIKGHSGYADSGEDIVCAAVSSVAYMVVNTITDVIKEKCSVEVHDNGQMCFSIQSDKNEVQAILSGMLIHLSGLAQQYPKNLKVTITEV